MGRLIRSLNRLWWTSDGWERGLWISAWLVAFAFAMGATIKCVNMASNAGQAAQDSNVLSKVDPPTRAEVIDAPGGGPSQQVEQAPVSTPTPEPANRQDCDVLRQTGVSTPAERAWFLAHCQAAPAASNGGTLQGILSAPSEADSGGGDTGPPPVQPPVEPPPQPTVEPPPPPEPSPAPGGEPEAIALAVQWLRTSSPILYSASADSCTAMLLTHWVVTCRARVAGCAEDGCSRNVTVCVDVQPPAVRPGGEC